MTEATMRPAFRLGFLDALRGIAVILMIIFHFFYDMNNLWLIFWNFKSGFWFALPRFIAGLFLFCVGLSLHYGHAGQFRKESFIQRSIKLFVSALLISVATFFAFPNAWIYFGTLHCIFLGSIFGVGFVYHRKAALLLMVLIIFAQYVLGYGIEWVSSLTNKFSMDFIPIYPWFWVVLAGILAAPYLEKSKLRNMKSPKFLTYLSRHSLKIYLLHQPVIYGSLLLYKNLKY